MNEPFILVDVSLSDSCVDVTGGFKVNDETSFDTLFDISTDPLSGWLGRRFKAAEIIGNFPKLQNFPVKSSDRIAFDL